MCFFFFLFCPLVYLLKFFPRPFQKWPRVHYKINSPGVYLFNEIPAAELSFEKFYCYSDILFSYFFLHLFLFDGDCFQYSQVLVSFLFFEHSDSLFCSFRYLSFSASIMSIAYFSMLNSIPISWLYILIQYIVLELPVLFHFSKQLDIVYVHEVINLFLQFYKFVALVYFLSMWLSGIIAITNCYDNSALQVIPFAVNSTFRDFRHELPYL